MSKEKNELDLNVSILEAIIEDRLYDIKAIVEKDSEIKTQIKNSFLNKVDPSPTDIMLFLVESSNGKNIEAIRILIDRYKADVNVAVHITETPLYTAVQNGHVEIAKLLIENEAVVKSVVLIVAAQNGHAKMVELLINNKADINVKLNDVMTPLYMAAQNGHVEVVELLISNEADIIPNALLTAADNGHERVVNLLIENKADVNFVADDGSTALLLAAQNGHEKVAELLILNKANVNYKVDRVVTPLYMAAQYGHKGVVELLIKNEANINDWEYATHIAANNNESEIVKLFIKKGIYIKETMLISKLYNKPGIIEFVKLGLFVRKLLQVDGIKNIESMLLQDSKKLLESNDKVEYDNSKYIEFFQSYFSNLLSLKTKEAVVKEGNVRYLLSYIHDNIKEAGLFEPSVIDIIKSAYESSVPQLLGIFSNFDKFKDQNFDLLSFKKMVDIIKYIKEGKIVKDESSDNFKVIDNDKGYVSMPAELTSLITDVQNIHNEYIPLAGTHLIDNGLEKFTVYVDNL